MRKSLTVALCAISTILVSCGYTNRARLRADVEEVIRTNDTSHTIKALEYRKFYQITAGQELLVAWVDPWGVERCSFGEFVHFVEAPDEEEKHRRLDTLETLRQHSPQLGPFRNLKPWDPYNVTATTSSVVLDVDGEIDSIGLWRTDAIVQVKRQEDYNGIDWGRTAAVWLVGALLTGLGILTAALAAPPDQKSSVTVRKGVTLGLAVWLMLLFLM